jgi:hypothetical protein
MSLSDIITVTLQQDSVGIRQAGFGVPLILSYSAAWVERTRTYESLADVATDFAATTPEYLMAESLFSQSIKPEEIKIGRCALKPTQKFTITPVVANLTAYTVTINDETFTYTSDGSASDTEIVDGLAALINASSAHAMTATTPGSPGTETLVITADAAGTFHSVSVGNPALLACLQDHADPGAATDLAAIALEDNDWYFILNPTNSKAHALAIAAYAEANTKIFVCQTNDTNIITLALGSDSTTSVAGQAKTSAYARTAILWHSVIGEFADCAYVGRFGPLDPGSESWIYKTLAGVSVDTLTSTHKTNLNAKHANFYHTRGGIGVVEKGTVSANEWIDVIRFRDWLEARLQESIFSRLAALNKIPITDKGIAVIEAEVRAVLQEGVTVGGISNDPAFEVTVPLASEISDANKTARTLPDVRFTATLAGAIHEIEITGVLSV